MHKSMSCHYGDTPSSAWRPLMFELRLALRGPVSAGTQKREPMDVRHIKLSMESLILAQDERWRRASCMQVERELAFS